MKVSAKILGVTALAGIFLSFTGGNAYAANEVATPTGVGCFETGECFIILASPLVGASSCVTDRGQIRWLSNQAGSEYMYKAALEAYLAGKRIVVNPYTASCVSGFMKPWYLYVTN